MRLRTVFEVLVWIALAVVLFLSAPSAPGSRVFFSPDTLERKSQSQELVVGTGIPNYRSRFSYSRYSLVDYLVSKGYWKPSHVQNPRWILVYQWESGKRIAPTEFTRQISWRGDDWIQWSEQHPDLAAVVWPQLLVVIRSNTEGMDALIWEILYCARESSDCTDFRKQLAQMECWSRFQSGRIGTQ